MPSELALAVSRYIDAHGGAEGIITIRFDVPRRDAGERREAGV